MSAAALTVTPDTDLLDRTPGPDLLKNKAAAEKAVRTMLAALDDALAAISDAREELHPTDTLPDTDTDTGGDRGVAARDQDITIRLHLDHAESDLRTAAAILRRTPPHAPTTGLVREIRPFTAG